MRRSPTSPGWPPAGWPGCWTARPTGRRCWPGSCPACRVPTRSCCAGCSVTRRVPVAAGVLLAAAAAGACRAAWRRAAALLAAGRQARHLPGTGQVVVTGEEAADAYTLPGWPCRIVVTAGMMRALSHPERQVLLTHERAHASGFHYLFTTAARLAAAANPLLRPVAAAVGY